MAQYDQNDDGVDYASAVRLYQADDTAKARTICDHLLARDPEHRRARKLLAVILFKQGNGAAAVDHMENLLAAVPDDADSHFTLAQMLASIG